MIVFLDVCGACFAFLSTVAYVRVSSIAWPLGLVAIVLDFILYYSSGLYGDSALNLVYFVLTFYGWYQWRYGGEWRTELPISSITKQHATMLGCVSVLSIAVIYFILHEFTNSQVPLLDAATTVLSLAAQWLICRKIIQCWYLWFVVDAMYVCLYFYKGIPAHSLLNIMYSVMAIAGFVHWQKTRHISGQVQGVTLNLLEN